MKRYTAAELRMERLVEKYANCFTPESCARKARWIWKHKRSAEDYRQILAARAGGASYREIGQRFGLRGR